MAAATPRVAKKPRMTLASVNPMMNPMMGMAPLMGMNPMMAMAGNPMAAAMMGNAPMMLPAANSRRATIAEDVDDEEQAVVADAAEECDGDHDMAAENPDLAADSVSAPVARTTSRGAPAAAPAAAVPSPATVHHLHRLQ